MMNIVKCFLKPLGKLIFVYIVGALAIASDITQLINFNIIYFIKKNSPISYLCVFIVTLLLYIFLVLKEFKKPIDKPKNTAVSSMQPLKIRLENKTSISTSNKIIFIIYGFVLICFLALIDFKIMLNLFLEINYSKLPAVIGALIVCFGLNGGSVFLGFGISNAIDKMIVKSEQSKNRTIFLISIGGSITLINFFGYFFIWRDFIITKGGFGPPHYNSYYSDIILMIIPLISAFLKFGVSVWISNLSRERKECKQNYV